MKRSLIRAALTGAVVGLSLLPSAAFAQRLTVADPKGDSHEIVQDPDTGAYSYPTVGSAPNSDFVRAVYRHTRSRIINRTTFMNLSHSGQGVIINAAIGTSTGLVRDAWVLKDPSKSGNRVAFHEPHGTPVPCSGMKRAIDWDANTVMVSVPRSCLGSPRWVTVSVSGGNYGDGTRRSYVDVIGTSTTHYHWSARIRRG